MQQLGMTDVASSSGSGRGRLLGFGLLFLIVVFALVRNIGFLAGGMLRPNFGLIQQAYDFNLFYLPLILLGAALFALVLGWFSPRLRRTLVRFAWLYVFLGADLFLLRYYVTNVEPQRLVLRSVRIETPKVQAPLRILHVSDIQSGAIGPYERKVFRRIAELEPDLILNTGDFLQVVPPAQFSEELPELIALMREVNPRYGTYGVFGDTELEMYRVPQEALAPMVLLSSRTAVIETPAGQVSVHGLSLYQSRKAEWALRTIEPWLSASDPDSFRILIGHMPDYAMGVGELPIDLCLAGHTHGGQVRLPFYGPLTTYSESPREWSRGFRRIGLPYLNVSAGVGSNRFEGLPPIRFNCPSEMTLIELVPLKSLR